MEDEKQTLTPEQRSQLKEFIRTTLLIINISLPQETRNEAVQDLIALEGNSGLSSEELNKIWINYSDVAKELIKELQEANEIPPMPAKPSDES